MCLDQTAAQSLRKVLLKVRLGQKPLEGLVKRTSWTKPSEGLVNLSIKSLEQCCETRIPDLAGFRRGENRFSRRVSFKNTMLSEGVV